MIKFDNVSVEYTKGIPALNNISFEIAKGEFVFLIGSTGSGKSTLLKTIYKQVNPSGGSIYLDDMDIGRLGEKQIPMLRQQLGIVFQDYKLLPAKNLWENLAFVLRSVGRDRRELSGLISEILDFVGLASKPDALPRELSGGEQQRAAIARALVNKPRILIADEPTGNLDPTTSMEIMEILDIINRETGMTMLIATHDKSVVNSMQKRVIQLEKGEIVRDEKEGRYDE
ncbi:MAG: ATP-binding cassette domain-containing protein [Abditibacteriota bacterium]|nr:ATP-binding cassette domain-containing protein [Abditibacteriota bacterium]